MAQEHLSALRRVRTPHQVVGAFDASPPAAAAFAALAGTKPFPTFEALVGDARPQLVHICTPAGRHFDIARAAVAAGVHVYVEKPFVETAREAHELLDLAERNGVRVCAGHQLVRDPSFERLMARGPDLAPLFLVDSYFAFRSPRLHLHRSSGAALAAQLLDILPHPLYTLIAALDRCEGGAPSEVVAATATATEVHALLRAGDAIGRLCVSLRARPLASTLTVTGAHGSLTADFIRGVVVGAANEGTGPLEKILNPFVEGGQSMWRTSLGLSRRLLAGGGYPGLAELFDAFYHAVASGGPSPLTPGHLLAVTSAYEALAAQVRAAPEALPTSRPPVASREGGKPLVVVTGASGFFGREIVGELSRRGFRVRGLGRSPDPGPLENAEWVRADLGGELDPAVLTGASAVVHAAAETAGGFEQHELNTVTATRNLVAAMAVAGVRRLVHVSSISVLRPPRSPWERQDERTPLPANAHIFGPYTWGKCVAEETVTRASVSGTIEARIVRPAALVDWDDFELPGLVGKRLFGRWYLGFGRPGLPFAVCDVRKAAGVIAWCVQRFEDAPPVLNLMEPELDTRARLLQASHARGWQGRFVWVPITIIAGLFQLLTKAMAVVRLRRPERRAIWAVLRPRHYDTSLAARALRAAEDDQSGSRSAGARSPSHGNLERSRDAAQVLEGR